MNGSSVRTDTVTGRPEFERILREHAYRGAYLQLTVVKHAGAQNVRVELARRDHRAVLVVSDGPGNESGTLARVEIPFQIVTESDDDR